MTTIRKLLKKLKNKRHIVFRCFLTGSFFRLNGEVETKRILFFKRKIISICMIMTKYTKFRKYINDQIRNKDKKAVFYDMAKEHILLTKKNKELFYYKINIFFINKNRYFLYIPYHKKNKIIISTNFIIHPTTYVNKFILKKKRNY